MKKSFFNVILFLLNVYCAVYFVVTSSRVLIASKANKITIWVWFALFTFSMFVKAVQQLQEMKLMKSYDEKFHKLTNRYPQDIKLADDINNFINDINNTIDTTNLKKYNKKHLLEMVEYLNNLLSTTISNH